MQNRNNNGIIYHKTNKRKVNEMKDIGKIYRALGFKSTKYGRETMAWTIHGSEDGN